MFANISHRLLNRAVDTAASKSACKSAPTAESKATGHLAATLFLFLSSIFLTSPVAAKAPSALGFDKAAFAASSQGRGVSKAPVNKNSTQQQKVDLNSASADEIAKTLSGVGPRKAQAMVKYRSEVGPFRSMDEVLEVKGFGPSILARNKDRIQLGKVAKKR